MEIIKKQQESAIKLNVDYATGKGVEKALEAIKDTQEGKGIWESYQAYRTAVEVGDAVKVGEAGEVLTTALVEGAAGGIVGAAVIFGASEATDLVFEGYDEEVNETVHEMLAGIYKSPDLTIDTSKGSVDTFAAGINNVINFSVEEGALSDLRELQEEASNYNTLVNDVMTSRLDAIKVSVKSYLADNGLANGRARNNRLSK